MQRRSLYRSSTDRGTRTYTNNNRRRQGGGGSWSRGKSYSSGGIDPRRFVNKAVKQVEEVVYEPTYTFADFDLKGGLKRNIESTGFTTPTPIQDQAIPLILEGKDLVGLANTGTGKTAAFVIPIINRLLDMPDFSSALIVAPTRELALQIDEQFRLFAKGSGLSSTLCVGGMNIHKQIMDLKRRPAVVIGTPGRLKDLFNRRILNLSLAHIVVLDEADQMLDMGFIDDIRFLIEQLPEERQSLCFSATMTPEINRLIQQLLNDPVTVSVKTNETSDHVEQDVIRARTTEQKLELLHDMLNKPEFEKVLIFGETKRGVQRLAEGLSDRGFRAEAIHGDKTQPQRQKALQAFKQDRVQVLVATDVAARGLDIPNVSHVINYDQPHTYQDYVHRIGRTGRAGKRGNALTFID
jgi:superfamily II DNA/RNA helicase